MNDGVNIEGSKIMIVDDTPQNLGVLEKMLLEKGYHVFAMTSGEAAVRSAASIMPELILLDIRMPGINGYETCRKLKENPALQDVSVIFLSAMNETEDKVKGFEAGGVDYITKPFQLEEVMARVKTHLTIRKLHQELKEHNARLESVVAERTRELASACKRLKSIERLKSDFLSMISHELRTPLNGVLVIGEIIFQERRKAGADDNLEELYACSRRRIEQLLDDARLINDLDILKRAAEAVSYPLDYFFEGHDIRVSFEMEAVREMPEICGELTLLKKAFGNIVKAAACFNKKKDRVEAFAEVAENAVTVRFKLDELTLSDEHIQGFFELASTARQSSPAQEHALAPVVACKIFELYGGKIKMARTEGAGGEFVLNLPLAPF